jgi:hypothetical protein
VAVAASYISSQFFTRIESLQLNLGLQSLEVRLIALAALRECEERQSTVRKLLIAQKETTA